jgi:serine-type D-Ala-D-Ala carboxypeptidase (penicillin-binding protein 5/6)
VGYRYLAATAAGALALIGGMAAAPAAPVPSGAASVRPSSIPCPIAPISVHRSRPPRPVPPPRDPDRPVVGGEGLATAGLTLPAGAPPPPRDLTATSWLVADLDSGEVLGACGPHEQSPPASVLKLLLAATVLPKLDPAQVVQVTPADLAIVPGSSAVGLVAGGRYPVKTLWLGLLLESGNDAANALARLGGGAAGLPGTMAAMNALARHLGALDTHAVTPSGLDAPGQFTSAYDLALIARVCFARADFRGYDTALTAQMPAQPPRGRAFQIQNENKLLTKYPGALGGKTGFTDLARHTYVGAAQRNGRRLVVTLLDAEPLPVRAWQQGASLLDWGFSVPAGASVGRLVAPGEMEARASQPPRPAPAAPAGTHPRDAAAAGRAPGLLGLSPTALGAAAAAVVLASLLAAVVVLRRRKLRRSARRARHGGAVGRPRPPGPDRAPR